MGNELRRVAKDDFSSLHPSESVQFLNDLDFLDTYFYFSPESAYKILDDMGETGRNLYLTGFEALDLIFPLIYTTFLISCLHLLFNGSSTFSIMLLYSPLLLGLVDYGENFCIFSMLSRYPVKLDFMAKMASFFNLAKWTLIAFFTLLIPAKFVLNRLTVVTVITSTKKPRSKTLDINSNKNFLATRSTRSNTLPTNTQKKSKKVD
ncbi:hypothetical protein HDU92_003470 [Lobulomyces angularis]|nr:hypothetical protein HDU92_003470 [Lobulomyces angularis]